MDGANRLTGRVFNSHFKAMHSSATFNCVMKCHQSHLKPSHSLPANAGVDGAIHFSQANSTVVFGMVPGTRKGGGECNSLIQPASCTQGSRRENRDRTSSRKRSWQYVVEQYHNATFMQAYSLPSRPHTFIPGLLTPRTKQSRVDDLHSTFPVRIDYMSTFMLGWHAHWWFMVVAFSTFSRTGSCLGSFHECSFHVQSPHVHLRLISPVRFDLVNTQVAACQH